MATSFYTRFPAGSATIAGSVDVNIHDANGNDIDLGQQAMADSVPVVIASDQTPLPISEDANTSSYAEITNLTTSAQTFTAPAGARGFLIQAPSTNAENIRWKVGAAATTTSGILMEPGRSEMLDAGGNISVIAAAGSNQSVYVQWVILP